MSNIKHKKLNKILPLFLAISSMSQGTFADSKIHNLKENKEVVAIAKEQKVDPKNKKIDKEAVDIAKEQKIDPKNKKIDKEKQKTNLKNLGSETKIQNSKKPNNEEVNIIHKFNSNAIYGKPWGSGETAKSASWAKYMDVQPSGANYWCQFFAFQGILNKEFNIKCKVPDLYDIAFPDDSDRDEKKFMLDESKRKEFMDKIIDKYQIQRKPYVVIKDMDPKHKDSPNYIENKQKIKEQLIEAYEKCGSLCINANYYSEHAVFVSDLNEEKNEITIETYGYSYVCDLDLFINNLVYNEYNYSEKLGDCLHDAKLRIYGFEKT